MQFKNTQVIRIVIIVSLLIAILTLGIVTCSLCRYASSPLPMSEEYALVAEKKLLNEYDKSNAIVEKETRSAKEQTRAKYEEDYIKSLTPDSPTIISVRERSLVPPSPSITSSSYNIIYAVPSQPYIIKAEIFTIEKEIPMPSTPQGEYFVIRTPESPLIISVIEEIVKVPLAPQIINSEVIITLPPAPQITSGEILSVPTSPHITNAETIHITTVPKVPRILSAESYVLTSQSQIEEVEKPNTSTTRILRYTLEIKRGNYSNAILINLDTNETYIGAVDPLLSTFTDNSTGNILII